MRPLWFVSCFCSKIWEPEPRSRFMVGIGESKGVEQCWTRISIGEMGHAESKICHVSGFIPGCIMMYVYQKTCYTTLRCIAWLISHIYYNICIYIYTYMIIHVYESYLMYICRQAATAASRQATNRALAAGSQRRRRALDDAGPGPPWWMRPCLGWWTSLSCCAVCWAKCWMAFSVSVS